MFKKISWLWGMIYCTIKTHIGETMAIIIIIWFISSLTSLCVQVKAQESYYLSNKKVVANYNNYNHQ